MTRANICTCGHIKSDHGGKKIESKYYPSGGACIGSNCSCQLFIFDHLEPLGQVSRHMLKMNELDAHGIPFKLRKDD